MTATKFFLIISQNLPKKFEMYTEKIRQIDMLKVVHEEQLHENFAYAKFRE